ncbi:MAG: hypothetical protein V4463_24295 [Pseudomonadota bacterium]
MKTILTLVLAATLASAHAAPQESAPAGYAQARAQFFAGLGGDSGARNAAIEAFQTLAAGNPGHPLLSAYAGAAIALKARDAWMPWKKMEYAEKGANTIEKALAQLTVAHDEQLFNGSPESVETRLVAANTLLALPDFMNRRAGGKHAIEAAMASPAFAGAGPVIRAGVLSAAAKVAAGEHRSADEITFLKQAVALAPQSQYGAMAASRLKELGQ